MEADKIQDVERVGSPAKEEPVAAPAETKVDDPKKSESKKKEIETYLNDSLGCLAIAFVMFGVVIYFLSSFK